MASYPRGPPLPLLGVGRDREHRRRSGGGDTKSNKARPAFPTFPSPFEKKTEVTEARQREQHQEILHGVRMVSIENFPKENLDHFIKFAFESKFGPVVESNFLMDRTGRLVGHGEVYFENEKNARAALSSPLTLNGRQMKLEYVSQVKPVPQVHSIQIPIQKSEAESAEEPFDNLYIKNITDSFKNEEDFVKVFRQFGPISSHKIEKHSDGSWVGFAFVRFENPDDARRALGSLHNRNLPNGKKLHVSKHESRVSRSKSESNVDVAPAIPSYYDAATSAKLILNDLLQQRKKPTLPIPDKKDKNLSSQSPRSVSEHSNGYGQERPPLTRTALNGIHRLESDDWESDNEEPVRRNVQNLRRRASLEDSGDESSSSYGSSLQPRKKLEPKKVYLNSQVKQPQNLYVKNFSGLLKTDDDLIGAFKMFGHILSVKLRGPNFGYVCFKNPEHAQSAIDTLHGKAIGNGKKLHVAKELSKEERQRTKDRNQERGDCEPEYLCAGPAITIPKGDTPCTICSKSNQKPVVILECQHLYCKPCLTKWLTICIDLEDLDAMHCQHGDCGEQFGMNLVKVLVGRKDFIKYDTLLLYNLLETMVDIVMCPKCGCPSSVDLDCPKALVSCKKCSWSFLPQLDVDSE